MCKKRRTRRKPKTTVEGSIEREGEWWAGVMWEHHGRAIWSPAARLPHPQIDQVTARSRGMQELRPLARHFLQAPERRTYPSSPPPPSHQGSVNRGDSSQIRAGTISREASIRPKTQDTSREVTGASAKAAPAAPTTDDAPAPAPAEAPASQPPSGSDAAIALMAAMVGAVSRWVAWALRKPTGISKASLWNEGA
jgi:hypothetical protein